MWTIRRELSDRISDFIEPFNFFFRHLNSAFRYIKYKGKSNVFKLIPAPSKMSWYRVIFHVKFLQQQHSISGFCTRHNSRLTTRSIFYQIALVARRTQAETESNSPVDIFEEITSYSWENRCLKSWWGGSVVMVSSEMNKKGMYSFPSISYSLRLSIRVALKLFRMEISFYWNASVEIPNTFDFL